jgi:hypothetical protein
MVRIMSNMLRENGIDTESLPMMMKYSLNTSVYLTSTRRIKLQAKPFCHQFDPASISKASEHLESFHDSTHSGSTFVFMFSLINMYIVFSHNARKRVGWIFNVVIVGVLVIMAVSLTVSWKNLKSQEVFFEEIVEQECFKHESIFQLVLLDFHQALHANINHLYYLFLVVFFGNLAGAMLIFTVPLYQHLKKD